MTFARRLRELRGPRPHPSFRYHHSHESENGNAVMRRPGC